MSSQISAGKLAQDLERVSELALDKLSEILTLPTDEENGALLRAQTGAAIGALQIQVRADALRLQAQREDKALETLLNLIREKERTTPQGAKESCAPPLHSLEHKSDGSLSGSSA